MAEKLTRKQMQQLKAASGNYSVTITGKTNVFSYLDHILDRLTDPNESPRILDFNKNEENREDGIVERYSFTIHRFEGYDCSNCAHDGTTKSDGRFVEAALVEEVVKLIERTKTQPEGTELHLSVDEDHATYGICIKRGNGMQDMLRP